MKVVTKYIDSIAEEKRFLIDELELTESFSFFHPELEDLRKMCNVLIDGKRTGGRLKNLTILKPVILNRNTIGFKDCITLETVSMCLNTEWDSFISPKHFSGCKSLKSIIIPKPVKLNNYHYYTKDGVLYNNFELVKYPANKGTEFTPPKIVNVISDYAFEDCQLTTLTFENPVPPICGDKAFEGVNPVTLTIKVPKGSYDSF